MQFDEVELFASIAKINLLAFCCGNHEIECYLFVIAVFTPLKPYVNPRILLSTFIVMLLLFPCRMVFFLGHILICSPNSNREKNVTPSHHWNEQYWTNTTIIWQDFFLVFCCRVLSVPILRPRRDLVIFIGSSYIDKRIILSRHVPWHK